MQYTNKDLKLLKDELEFIDTAVIPFVSIDMDEEALRHANNSELVQMVGLQLEKQFKGRLMLTPVVSTIGEDTGMLINYRHQLLNYGFQNVIVLTPLKLQPDDMNVIRLNEIPLEDMSRDMKAELVGDEVKNAMKKIIAVWNN